MQFVKSIYGSVYDSVTNYLLNMRISEDEKFEQFTQLPLDIIVEIAKKMEPEDVVSFLNTNKVIRNLTSRILKDEALVEKMLDYEGYFQGGVYLPRFIKRELQTVKRTVTSNYWDRLFKPATQDNLGIKPALFTNITEEEYGLNNNGQVFGKVAQQNKIDELKQAKEKVVERYKQFPNTKLEPAHLVNILLLFELDFSTMPQKLREQVETLMKTTKERDVDYIDKTLFSILFLTDRWDLKLPRSQMNTLARYFPQYQR